MTSVNGITNIKTLLQYNYEWWANNKDVSEHFIYNTIVEKGLQYSKNNIIEENPTFGEKLIELNKYIITIDSQDNNSNNLIPQTFNEYLDKIQGTNHCDRILRELSRYEINNSLEKNSLFKKNYVTIARPYIEAWVQRKKVNDIIKLLEKENIAVCSSEGQLNNKCYDIIEKNRPYISLTKIVCNVNEENTYLYCTGIYYKHLIEEHYNSLCDIVDESGEHNETIKNIFDDLVLVYFVDVRFKENTSYLIDTVINICKSIES